MKTRRFSAIPREGRAAQAVWWVLPILVVLALGAASAGAVGARATRRGAEASSLARTGGRPSVEAAARPGHTSGGGGLLRVCADPNNLPFSDRQGRGFENKLAELIANDLHERLAYYWWAQRRGFIRNTLKAHKCDVVMGVGAGDDMLLTSTPYYRSTYVFVQRTGRTPIRTFDDPRLRHLRIGIHVIGDDGNALPPGLALSRRGLIPNVRGYSIYGNYAQPAPPARLIDAVARGDVDVAVAWGPLAGFFAPREPKPLAITRVANATAIPGIPFSYAISIGVRRGEQARLAQLEDVLRRRAPEVRAILRSYGVPLVRDPTTLIAVRSGEGR